MCETSAHASLTVLLGEPFGSFGTMMPLGHTAIYLDRVCAEGPLKLRACREGEARGVVIARYHAVEPYDWLAAPVMDFLYGTETPAEMQTYATPESMWAMREAFRERFLRDIVPDGTEGVRDKEGCAKHAHGMEEWCETSGMAYYRKFWAYEIATTPEQDARLIEVMNADANRHRYHLNGANCADFAAEIVNLYYPGAVSRADRVADYGLMTPKHVVRSLTDYAARHEEIDLHVWEMAQLPGSLRRSKHVWGGVESALKTKRYVFTLLALQPEIPLVLEVLYLKHGRWKVGVDAERIRSLPYSRHSEILDKSSVPWIESGSQENRQICYP
jgi:hypothetical protein